MSDSFRLGLGLVCMFFAGWFTLATLLTAKDICVDFLDRLRYRQRVRAEIWPSDWNIPASFRHLEASLLEWLTGRRQGRVYAPKIPVFLVVVVGNILNNK